MAPEKTVTWAEKDQPGTPIGLVEPMERASDIREKVGKRLEMEPGESDVHSSNFDIVLNIREVQAILTTRMMKSSVDV